MKHESQADEISRQTGRIAALLARPAWNAERVALRGCLLAAGLVETVKWNQLCYCVDQHNVAIIFAMKASCGIGFFKGSLLHDPAGRLSQQGPNAQAMREFRFTDLTQIETARAEIMGLILDAIRVEKAGMKVEFAQKHALVLPVELQAKFAGDAAFGRAFAGLTPGRQRAYVLDFAGAKQEATRVARIEKHRARIMAGKGIADRE